MCVVQWLQCGRRSTQPALVVFGVAEGILTVLTDLAEVRAELGQSEQKDRFFCNSSAASWIRSELLEGGSKRSWLSSWVIAITKAAVDNVLDAGTVVRPSRLRKVLKLRIVNCSEVNNPKSRDSKSLASIYIYGLDIYIYIYIQDGNTSFIIAVWGGHLEVVKLLLDKGADVNRATKVSMCVCVCVRARARAPFQDSYV